MLTVTYSKRETPNMQTVFTVYSRDEWDEFLGEPISGVTIDVRLPCSPGEPARRFAALFYYRVISSTKYISYDPRKSELVFGLPYFGGYEFESCKNQWRRHFDKLTSDVIVCHPMGSELPQYESPPTHINRPPFEQMPLFEEDWDSIQADMDIKLSVKKTVRFHDDG